MFGGVVFEDGNHNLKLDDGEKGIPGVLVSNGKEVVQTDENGRYSLRQYDEMVFFITKPAQYNVPVNSNQLPQFYYIYQPKGSSNYIREYQGITLTGNLPLSVNFLWIH